MSKNGLIITITGPSGTGKNTISQELIKRDPRINYFVTATTRPPRAYEKDGKDYYFLTKEDFIKKLDNNEFIEWSEHYGNYYGALRSEVENKLASGTDPLSDITWTGAASIAHNFPDNTVKILLLPPSLEALNERFSARKTISAEKDDAKRVRTEKIMQDMEFWQDPGYVFINDDMKGSQTSDYDHVVTNGDIDQTVKTLLSIIEAERNKLGLK